MDRRAHRARARCTHGRGRALCFECFKDGSERTKARQEAWAQRALPFDEAESVQPLTPSQVAHRKRMLAHLQRASVSRQRA